MDGLQVSGEPGSVDGGAEVSIVGPRRRGVGGLHGVRSTAPSILCASATAGNRYLVVLSAEIEPRDDLEIVFSKALAADLPGIEVVDSRGNSVEPAIEPVGSTRIVRIAPQPAWRAGERYQLRLGTKLADADGNAWGRGPRRWSSRSPAAASSTPSSCRRCATSNAWAASSSSPPTPTASWCSTPPTPATCKNLVDGDVRFPFPLGDPVMAVAVDPHGRVLVAGGGVNGFGQLKVFDPLALDPAAVAAAPGDPAVRYAAFRGSTVVSDPPAGGTSLPEGRPRHVAVLSDDDTARWRFDLDAVPAGPDGGDGGASRRRRLDAHHLRGGRLRPAIR